MKISHPRSEGDISVRRAETLSWLLLLAMTMAGGVVFSPRVAWSLFLGGLLVNVSFWLLKRDITRFLAGPLTGVKARFLVKYYLRLTLLALVLFVLVKKVPLNLGALLVGLGCVAVSIIATVLVEARKTFSGMKEA